MITQEMDTGDHTGTREIHTGTVQEKDTGDHTGIREIHTGTVQEKDTGRIITYVSGRNTESPSSDLAIIVRQVTQSHISHSIL